MAFEIWKEINSTAKFVDNDNEWEEEIKLHLVCIYTMGSASKDWLKRKFVFSEEAWAEYQADCYGDQDYSFKVEFKKIARLEKADVLPAIEMLEKLRNKFFIDEV